MKHELTVDASIDVEGTEGRIAVRGSGQTLELRPESFRACLALLASGPGMSWRSRSARRLHAMLDHGGLSLEVRLGRRMLLRLGRRARPSWLARYAGVPEAQLGWLGVPIAAVAAVRRSRPRRVG